MKRPRAIAVSILFFLISGAGVSAVEMSVGTHNSDLERINFEVALETAMRAEKAEDRQVVLTSNQTVLPEYENGDFYFLHGNLTGEWVNREWDMFYDIVKWLIRSHFKVIVNPYANAEHVKEAVQNPRTSIIIWSSHGSKVGELFDTDNQVLPKDVFSANASKSLIQIILSNCHGETTVQYYSFPNNVKIKHWIGLSTTKDLFDYLLSDQWSNDLLSE